MDFEELALKGVDPSLGPSITHPQLGSRSDEKLAKEGQSGGKTRITVSHSDAHLFKFSVTVVLLNPFNFFIGCC
jgi:hypothetical protein